MLRFNRQFNKVDSQKDLFIVRNNSFHIVSWYFRMRQKLLWRAFRGFPQPLFTCFKTTMETPGQCVKYVKSWRLRRQNDVIDVVLVSLLLTLYRFRMLVVWCFYCWLGTSKCQLRITLAVFGVLHVGGTIFKTQPFLSSYCDGVDNFCNFWIVES